MVILAVRSPLGSSISASELEVPVQAGLTALANDPAFQWGGGDYTTIAALDVTITTKGGPVLATLDISYAGADTHYFCICLDAENGSTSIDGRALINGKHFTQSRLFTALAAGSHTFHIRFKSSSGYADTAYRRSSLKVVELST